MSQQPQQPTQQQPTPPMRATPARSNGFMGWLGRQVGYVKKAIDTDVTAAQIVYRKLDVREQRHPSHANVTLRRTTIDEAIVTRQLPAQGPHQPTPAQQQGGRPAEQSGGGR